MGKRAVPLRFVCRSCGAERETYSTSKKGIYCDKQCRADFERKGRDEPCRYIQDGHWMLRWNEGGKLVYQFEHRRIWEEANGPIPDGHIIHHRNHDPLDNRLENLQLMQRGEHIAHHKRKPDLYPDGPGTPTDYQREYRKRKRG